MRFSLGTGFSRMSTLLLPPALLSPISARAHEGHVLDLVSAVMQPLAGWDHLLMALVFLGVLGVSVRMMVKARSRGQRDVSKDQP
jgi:hydrogenase/urease accessory protein HupE